MGTNDRTRKKLKNVNRVKSSLNTSKNIKPVRIARSVSDGFLFFSGTFIPQTRQNASERL